MMCGESFPELAEVIRERSVYRSYTRQTVTTTERLPPQRFCSGTSSLILTRVWAMSTTNRLRLSESAAQARTPLRNSLRLTPLDVLRPDGGSGAFYRVCFYTSIHMYQEKKLCQCVPMQSLFHLLGHPLGHRVGWVIVCFWG